MLRKQEVQTAANYAKQQIHDTNRVGEVHDDTSARELGVLHETLHKVPRTFVGRHNTLGHFVQLDVFQQIPE